MIDIQQFENIKQKHGSYASWAVWADASEKPKSNMEDVSHFTNVNESVLSLLKNNVVMVGLNISRRVSEPPFINFHDPSPRANDFKIRFAFKDSAYYGAYMTDIIKSFEEVDSANVMKFLKERPETIEKHLGTFRQEMQDLKATAPVIFAFAKDTHKILSDNLNKNEYRKLIKLTHYSHRIGKEAYRDTVFKEIGGHGSLW